LDIIVVWHALDTWPCHAYIRTYVCKKKKIKIKNQMKNVFKFRDWEGWGPSIDNNPSHNYEWQIKKKKRVEKCSVLGKTTNTGTNIFIFITSIELYWLVR
jgi:hypothetical protein